MKREIKDVQAGDVIQPKGSSSRYSVLLRQENLLLVGVGAEGNYPHVYSVQYLEKSGWTIEVPLTAPQKAAKKMLESLGFTVKR